MEERDIGISEEYQYGFHDQIDNIYDTGKGISEQVIIQISKLKNEPQWMLDFRLQAYQNFKNLENPSYGPSLAELDFDNYTYYIKSSDKNARTWDDVPEKIKDTFDKLGIPEAEAKYLSGVATQYESEVVYHNMIEELEEKGVIFCDTDTALREYPELFKKYFGTIVASNDNKYAALNSAVWSGGSFIYVPKNVKVEKPLQSYFRINSQNMGQFERTLIIVDEGAEVHYVEGCTAPIYDSESLHAAVVEIVVLKNASCRYSTIQNWSTNIYNLVTKRAYVYEHAKMEWIDGNIGACVTMKYPSCYLVGEYAKGVTISIAVASGFNQIQDAGAKMLHLASHTSSSVISKSVCRKGGKVNYRDLIYIDPRAEKCKTKIECDTLILDNLSTSDTVPNNINKNYSSRIEHEATVSKVSEEQIFYLTSRGIPQDLATEMIVMGFLEPFTRELPMEYAVELNQLLKLDMTGSVG